MAWPSGSSRSWQQMRSFGVFSVHLAIHHPSWFFFFTNLASSLYDDPTGKLRRANIRFFVVPEKVNIHACWTRPYRISYCLLTVKWTRWNPFRTLRYGTVIFYPDAAKGKWKLLKKTCCLFCHNARIESLLFIFFEPLMLKSGVSADVLYTKLRRLKGKVSSTFNGIPRLLLALYDFQILVCGFGNRRIRIRSVLGNLQYDPSLPLAGRPALRSKSAFLRWGHWRIRFHPCGAQTLTEHLLLYSAAFDVKMCSLHFLDSSKRNYSAI